MPSSVAATASELLGPLVTQGRDHAVVPFVVKRVLWHLSFTQLYPRPRPLNRQTRTGF